MALYAFNPLAFARDMNKPAPPLLLALFEPDIAQNTGAMMRTCACLGVDAAIIEPAGFRISDSRFRRAAMDYIHAVRIESHEFMGDLRGVARRQSTPSGAVNDKGRNVFVGFRFS